MQRLAGLQVLRAFAAALVLFQHAYFYSGQAIGDDVLEFRLLQVGTFGVVLFFFISGVVMAIVTRTDSAHKFALSRLLRIYPPYFVALGLSAALLHLTGAGAPAWNWDPSLFLLPSGSLNSSFYVPYWTLIYEIFFYALLWLILLMGLARTARAWLMVIWAAAVLMAATMGSSVPLNNPSVLQIFIAPMNLFFISGYTLGNATLERDPKPLAVVLLLVAFAAGYGQAVNTLILAWLIACCALAGLANSLGPLWPKFLVRFGDYSYGLYLMHLPVVFIVFALVRGEGWSFPALLATTLAAGAFVGLSYGWLEHFTHARLSKLLVARLSPADGASTVASTPRDQVP